MVLKSKAVTFDFFAISTPEKSGGHITITFKFCNCYITYKNEA